MHINLNRQRVRSVLCGTAGVMVLIGGYASRANAQFTYANTTSAAGLTVGTFIGGTAFTATPVTAGTATDGTITAAGSHSGIYSNNQGSYSGTGSSDLTYNFDPTGIVASVGLNGTADAIAGNGDANDDVTTVPSGGVGTDFMVSTTGQYLVTATNTFGGRASSQFGALFVTYTVNDDTNGSGFSLTDNQEDENPTPDSPGALDEVVTLTAGDRYTLAFGASLNPASAADSAPLSSSLTGSAAMSITVVPKPASLSLLGLTAISLGSRRMRRRRGN
jgi:hypothetical protein